MHWWMKSQRRNKICSSKLCWGSKNRGDREGWQKWNVFPSVHRSLCGTSFHKNTNLDRWLCARRLRNRSSDGCSRTWWTWSCFCKTFFHYQFFRLWKLLQVLISWNNPLMQRREMHQFRFSEWSMKVKKQFVQSDRRNWKKKGIGSGKVNFRLRCNFWTSALLGRTDSDLLQRQDSYPLEEKDLPLVLPEVDALISRLKMENHHWQETRQWKYKGQFYDYELTTMPGWAGSSWYFLRYMDAQRQNLLQKALNYWQDVDLYMGGAEHATGHLLYVRFWTKFLYDLGFIPVQEPAKIDQSRGMIQGRLILFIVCKR